MQRPTEQVGQNNFHSFWGQPQPTNPASYTPVFPPQPGGLDPVGNWNNRPQWGHQPTITPDWVCTTPSNWNSGNWGNTTDTLLMNNNPGWPSQNDDPMDLD